MKKRTKYWLMGAGISIGALIPVLAVVSCSEITRNSTTNTYYAFSAFSGKDISASTINDVAMNEMGSSNIVSKIGTGNYSSLSSVTSWYIKDTGSTTGMVNSTGLGYKNGLNSNNGTASSIGADAWLQQDNATIVEELFTSLLNFFVSNRPSTNYLGQTTLENSGTSYGLLRLLSEAGVTEAGLNSSLSNNGVDLGTFAQDLESVASSSNGQTSYYLFPTDVFYTTTSSNVKTNATYWNTTNGNSKYDSLLASYMPDKIASNISGDTPANGATENYDGQISVAKVEDIKIVFEFYCSAPYSDYTTNQPINCTQTPTKDFDLHNGVVSYPEINGKQLDYNPYYGEYFVLNLNPILVSLQNIGLGKASTSSDSSSSSSSSSDDPVNLTDYAALNYYGSLNAPYYALDDTKLQIFYNEVTDDSLTKIAVKYDTSSLSYEYYYHTPAAAWCFCTNSYVYSQYPTISNIYQMQQDINAQAKFYSTANTNGTSTKLSSNDISAILSFLNSSGTLNNQTYNTAIITSTWINSVINESSASAK